jgi:hypothetical protein
MIKTVEFSSFQFVLNFEDSQAREASPEGKQRHEFHKGKAINGNQAFRTNPLSKTRCRMSCVINCSSGVGENGKEKTRKEGVKVCRIIQDKIYERQVQLLRRKGNDFHHSTSGSFARKLTIETTRKGNQEIHCANTVWVVKCQTLQRADSTNSGLWGNAGPHDLQGSLS